MRRELARVVLGGFWSQDGRYFQAVSFKDHAPVTLVMGFAPEIGSRLTIEEYQTGAWRVAERQLAGVG